MITAPAVDSRAINFLESLTLPSGLTLGEAKGRDPWLADDVLTPVMVLDEAGLPVNRHAWIELHRGAGKTTLAAAISLTEAIRGAETEIIAIASDTDQALYPPQPAPRRSRPPHPVRVSGQGKRLADTGDVLRRTQFLRRRRGLPQAQNHR